MFLGLRTAIYPASDVAASKKWWSEVLGVEPYFDEPFYVGFNVAGYELGIVPSGEGDGNGVTYWGVTDADAAVERLVAAGAEVHSAVEEVGDGIRLGTVREPSGNLLGVIANPLFDLSGVTVDTTGPGR